MPDVIIGTPGDFANEGEAQGQTHMMVELRALRRWQEGLHSAFDLGFKAAGGAMIPDGARDMVELALDRKQIEVLANAAEVCSHRIGVEMVALSFDRPGEQDALKRFLETINIYRRKYAEQQLSDGRGLTCFKLV